MRKLSNAYNSTPAPRAPQELHSNFQDHPDVELTIVPRTARTIEEQTGWKRPGPVTICQKFDVLRKVTEYDYDLLDPEFQEYCVSRGTLYKAGRDERFYFTADLAATKNNVLLTISIRCDCVYCLQIGVSAGDQVMYNLWKSPGGSLPIFRQRDEDSLADHACCKRRYAGQLGAFQE